MSHLLIVKRLELYMDLALYKINILLLLLLFIVCICWLQCLYLVDSMFVFVGFSVWFAGFSVCICWLQCLYLLTSVFVSTDFSVCIC